MVRNIPDSRKHSALYAPVINALRSAPHGKWVMSHHHHHHHRLHLSTFENRSWDGSELRWWAIAAYAHHGHALIWFAMNRFCIVPPRLRGRPPLHNSWTSHLTRVSLFTGENLAIVREVSRIRENHRNARFNIGISK